VRAAAVFSALLFACHSAPSTAHPGQTETGHACHVSPFPSVPNRAQPIRDSPTCPCQKHTETNQSPPRHAVPFRPISTQPFTAFQRRACLTRALQCLYATRLVLPNLSCRSVPLLYAPVPYLPEPALPKGEPLMQRPAYPRSLSALRRPCAARPARLHKRPSYRDSEPRKPVGRGAPASARSPEGSALP
jgi:hypothetical protein